MKKASVCVYVFVCVCQYMTVAQVVSVCALAPPPGHVLVYHIVCMCIIISRRYIYILCMQEALFSGRAHFLFFSAMGTAL